VVRRAAEDGGLKPLVRRCYDLWYARLLADADSVPERYRGYPIVDLDSGSSYIKELRREIVTSRG
jgi:hypothetical protein